MSVCSQCLLDAESGSPCPLLHLLSSRHRQADAGLQLWRRVVHRGRQARSQRLLLRCPGAVWRHLHHAHGVLGAPAVAPHHCRVRARHDRPCWQQHLSGSTRLQDMSFLAPKSLSDGAFPDEEDLKAGQVSDHCHRHTSASLCSDVLGSPKDHSSHELEQFTRRPVQHSSMQHRSR